MTTLNEIITKRSVDAILVTDQYNFHYLSGFGGEGILFITTSGKYLLTDSRYTMDAKAKSAAKGFTVYEYNAAHPEKELLADIIKADNVNVIGFEDINIKYADYHKYTEMFPEATFVPLDDDLETLRMIKTSEEIEYLAQAEHIGDMALADVLPKIKVGMTELEVAAELEYAMKRHGAEGLSFDTIVAAGPGSASPHHVPCDYQLQEGDFITMDFGCIYKGYCSDMTRTVVLGQASDEQKKVYNTVLKAQLAGLDALKAGKTGKEVDKVARDIITEAGYGEYFGHGLGHSVGLFIHEEPRLSPSEERTLVAGNVETVEPGIYIEGFGGVRIEDMTIVTEDGHRNFASSPKELIELEV